MKPTAFTIGLIQMRCDRDPAKSLAHAVDRLRDAARRGVRVACLPELFLTEYFCQTEDPAVFDRAEPVPGPTTLALDEVARETGMAIIGSVFERRASGVYHNTATVHDPAGGLVGTYRKMHIPDDPLFLEKFYFTPGDLGFKVFTTPAAKVGTLVCWDQWYPEAARLTALQGAEVIFYPTAIGWHPKEKAEFGEAQHAAWETSMRGHAIANGTYVCGVNRVGHEVIVGEGLEFWGGSFVSDPFGRVIAKASHDKEEVLVVTCDRKHMEDVRRNWPFFRDRRIDAYAGVTKRVAD